jgi:hypothetical protein
LIKKASALVLFSIGMRPNKTIPKSFQDPNINGLVSEAR